MSKLYPVQISGSRWLTLRFQETFLLTPRRTTANPMGLLGFVPTQMGVQINAAWDYFGLLGNVDSPVLEPGDLTSWSPVPKNAHPTTPPCPFHAPQTPLLATSGQFRPSRGPQWHICVWVYLHLRVAQKWFMTFCYINASDLRQPKVCFGLWMKRYSIGLIWYYLLLYLQTLWWTVATI